MNENQKKKKNYSKRMPSEVRRTLLIETAAELFYRKGFAATSLDDIISRTGGSKRTVYTEFGGKKGLYKAALVEKKDQFFTFSLECSNSDLHTALVEFGEKLLKIKLTPTLLSVLRVALRDCLQFPQIARIHFETIPDEVTKHIIMILERAVEKKEIHPQNCLRAAHNFTELIYGRLYWQVVYKLRPAPSAREIRQHVEFIVDFFLNGLRGTKNDTPMVEQNLINRS